MQRKVIVFGVVVLALNLRPAAGSIGPVLEEVTSGLHMGAVSTGVLTALPVASFGVFGALAPYVARATGLHRLTFLAVLAIVAGIAARSLTGSVPVFLALSVLALAGMAVGNVLLPSLVKLHFPDRVGAITALYTTSMAIGLALASVATVPLTDGLGSWRWGLGAWAAPAALAVLPWLVLTRHDSGGVRTAGVPLREVARTRLGWTMALLFGLQSSMAYTIFGWFAQVYRDAGFSAGRAGLLLGVITGIGIPLSVLGPVLAARVRDQARLMLGLAACYPVGYLGLAFAPVAGAWLWAVLVGTAASIFPVVLTLIGLRSRTPEGTAALSGFTQGVGYVLAGTGPFAIGLLHDATGGWRVPMFVLTGIAALTALLATSAGRPRFIEDELAALSR